MSVCEAGRDYCAIIHKSFDCFGILEGLLCTLECSQLFCLWFRMQTFRTGIGALHFVLHSRRRCTASISERWFDQKAFMKVGTKSCLLLEVISSRLHHRIRLSSSKHPKIKRIFYIWWKLCDNKRNISPLYTFLLRDAHGFLCFTGDTSLSRLRKIMSTCHLVTCV